MVRPFLITQAYLFQFLAIEPSWTGVDPFVASVALSS